MIGSIIVLGDSSSVGFGTKGRSYPVLTSAALGGEHLEVIAALGKTTEHALEHDLVGIAAQRPDLIILQTGMADSLLHPGERVQKLMEHFAPASWHGVDGLERRAVFNGGWQQRFRQRAASATKTRLKRTLVTVTGGYTRMTATDYGRCLDQLLTGLESTGAIVVSIGIYKIDEAFFPRQARTSAPFIDVRRQVLSRHPKVVAVEPDDVMRRWDDYLGDHGHWNAEGHARLAGLVVRRLREAGAGLQEVEVLGENPVAPVAS